MAFQYVAAATIPLAWAAWRLLRLKLDGQLYYGAASIGETLRSLVNNAMYVREEGKPYHMAVIAFGAARMLCCAGVVEKASFKQADDYCCVVDGGAPRIDCRAFIVQFSRSESTVALTQLPGTQGCVGDTGDEVTCAHGNGLSEAESLALSPDGNYLYAASSNNSLAIFSRNTSTGVLT
jgi:hypothetical protein